MVGEAWKGIKMIGVAEVEAFVHQDYADKDTMHGLDHIRRVYRLAQRLGEKHAHDGELLMLGAYFHGIIYLREADIRRFLEDHRLLPDVIDRVVQIAWESQKESAPKTIEGVLLHDAHLIEGEKTFIITKSLVTGAVRGQTLEEIIRFIEEKILGKHVCSLPEAQRLYEEKEEFARQFIEQ
jgi:uncharacterized protein